jgi:predicted regulator of Ras-like GTPase activity (Roadblock/LC7/MglB family)
MSISSSINPEVSHALMEEIQRIESGTELKRVAVISKTGMSIASATSDQMDADAETASSAALIDLAERLSDSVSHGSLREILIKADSGFVILQSINDEYMIFGGISNPLKIGFYMEYLRSKAISFAFLLAGNVVTDALKSQITEQREREQRIKEEAKRPLGEDFKTDKSVSSDMEAMKGVLDFLKNWNDEDSGGAPAASAENIVGIDQDLLFTADTYAPKPISDDQIQMARSKSEELQLKGITKGAGTSAEDEDLISAIAADMAKSPENKPKAQAAPSRSSDLDLNAVGLPQDILSTLDEISGQAPESKVNQKARASAASSSPYGITLFDQEVPPVPLDDYVAFELGTLVGSAKVETEQETGRAESMQTSGAAGLNADVPNFDLIASEYNDPDLAIEEDAMLSVLNELGIAPDKKKKTE